MTAVYAGLAVLALAGWFRTRRWQKVRGLDLALAVTVGLVVSVADSAFRTGSLIAAAVVALVLTIIAPPRAWVPLAVAAAFALTVEPWNQVRTVEPGWFAYEPGPTTNHVVPQWGSQPDWGGLIAHGTYESLGGIEMSHAYATSLVEEPGLSLAALVLAAGLVGWAARRRNIPVALLAIAFGVLAAYSPAPALLPLAATALAVYPRDRTYPFFTGGVVLLAVVAHTVLAPSGPYSGFGVDALWIWLAGIVIASGLLVWALARRDAVASAVALAALLVTWPSRPEPAEPGMRFLSQEQFADLSGPVLWPMIFPVALPAVVLIAGALVQRRVQLRRNV